MPEVKYILRVVALGPLPNDRRIILIEMPMETAKNYELAKNVIMDRLKQAGLIISSSEPHRLYWICKYELDVFASQLKLNFSFYRPWEISNCIINRC